MEQSKIPQVDPELEKALNNDQELDQETIDRAIEQGMQQSGKENLDREQAQSPLNKQTTEEPE